MTFGIWLAYVFLVMTIGEAEEPFQTAHLIKATLEETVAERPHPLGGSRRFRVGEMEDFDDIPIPSPPCLFSGTHRQKFDCKTCMCWGACWCGWLTKCTTDASSLPNTMSFLCYSAMLSFSSESQVDPPLWTNPVHPPVICPCVDECCACTTRCMVCDENCGTVEWDKCGCVPKRPNPRSQLYLLWRSRFNGQQPDLTTVLRPYMDLNTTRMKDDEEEGLLGRVMDLMQDNGLLSRDTPEQESMLDSNDFKAPEEKLKAPGMAGENQRKLRSFANSWERPTPTSALRRWRTELLTGPR
eukprot:s1025_g17.t1